MIIVCHLKVVVCGVKQHPLTCRKKWGQFTESSLTEENQIIKSKRFYMERRITSNGFRKPSEYGFKFTPSRMPKGDNYTVKRLYD